MISRAWLEDWCKHHNAVLIQMKDKGFSYQTYNGIIWYMPYDEMYNW